MSKKNNKKKRYVPLLSRGNLDMQRDSWKEKAPKLTQEELTKVQEIVRSTYSQHLGKPPTRHNFSEMHERIEEELNDKMSSNLNLMGALEWKATFGESATYYFEKMGMKNPQSIDGIIPTTDFLESELFDYIQEFNPILVLLQFADYDKYMKSAEQSIKDAEHRREDGDAYFTQRERDISYRSDIGSSDSLDD